MSCPIDLRVITLLWAKRTVNSAACSTLRDKISCLFGMKASMPEWSLYMPCIRHVRNVFCSAALRAKNRCIVLLSQPTALFVEEKNSFLLLDKMSCPILFHMCETDKDLDQRSLVAHYSRRSKNWIKDFCLWRIDSCYKCSCIVLLSQPTALFNEVLRYLRWGSSYLNTGPLDKLISITQIEKSSWN